MKNKNSISQVGTRGREIVRLLHRHGPLTPGSLMVMMEPKITRRRLNDAIRRLADKHLLYKRRISVYGDKNHFYQIDRHSSARMSCAQILDPSTQEPLQKPIYLIHNPFHSEFCALWTARLERLFPEAKVLRKFESVKDPD